MAELYDEERQNDVKLMACPTHAFRPVPNKVHGFTTRYECENCGGSVGAAAAQWYMRGLSHGSQIK